MKNLKKSILAACLALCMNAIGQEVPEVQFAIAETEAELAETENSYLLADRVYLRKCGSTDCKKIGVLPIGTSFTVLEKNNNPQVINGLKSNWYRIKTKDNHGWLWGGFIAERSFGSDTNADIKFVFGRARTEKDSTGAMKEFYQLRAFKHNTQLGKIVFESSNIDAASVKNIGNKGVYNLEDIITISLPADASNNCKTTEMYIFWNNRKFTHVGNLTNIADTTNSLEETLVFPSDMEGKKGLIIKKSSKVDAQYLAENPAKVRRNVTTTMYKWIGGKIKQMDLDPVVVSHNSKL